MYVYPPRDAVLAALQHPNVRAMEHVILEGETNQTANAFRTINGGALFESFEKHPFEGMSTRAGGKAAGAHQWIPSTWAEIRDHYDLPDFSPQSQTFAFVARMAWRGALDDVLRGNFEQAVMKLREEWTSLPGAAENSGRYTMDEAKQVYYLYHGFASDGEVPSFTQPEAPVTETDPDADGKPGVTIREEDRVRLNPPPRETTMDPISIFAIFGPIIANLIPQLGKLFVNPEDKKQQRNMDAIQLVLDTFTRAALPNVPGASGVNVAHVAQAVEAVKADPVLKETVTKEVLTTPGIIELVEIGGGIAKAREYDAATMGSDKPFWKSSAVFWISLVLLPMVYWFVGSLIAGGILQQAQVAGMDLPDWLKFVALLFGNEWNGETRSGGFNLVVGLVLGGICGVYFGVSVSQMKQARQQSGGGDA